MSVPADPRARPKGKPGLGAALARYTLARVGLLALIATLLLLAGAPLLIALLVALVVALPLSMLVFRGLRTRLDTALAASRARRGEERAVLRAGLRGAEPAAEPQPVEPAEPEPAEPQPVELAGRHPVGPAEAAEVSDDRPEREPDARRD